MAWYPLSSRPCAFHQPSHFVITATMSPPTRSNRRGWTRSTKKTIVKPVLSPYSKVLEKDRRQRCVKDAVSDAMKQLMPGGRIQKHTLTTIVAKYGKHGVTKDILKKAIQKAKVEHSTAPPAHVIAATPASDRTLSDISQASSSESISESHSETSASKSYRTNAGRPKGTTLAAKQHQEDKLKEAMADAAARGIAAQEQAQANGKKLYGFTKPMLTDVEIQHSLSPGMLHNETTFNAIKMRVQRKNPSGLGKSQKSPVEEIEATIVDICVHLSRIGQPMDKNEVIQMANEMIVDTPHYDIVCERKIQRKQPPINNDGNVLGAGWYRRFMKRWEKIV